MCLIELFDTVLTHILRAFHSADIGIYNHNTFQCQTQLVNRGIRPLILGNLGQCTRNHYLSGLYASRQYSQAMQH